MIASIRFGLLALVAFAAAGISPVAAQTQSPAGAKVYIINLKDGAEVTSPFLVQFGLKDLSELPTLKEFEELGRMEIAEPETEGEVPAADSHPEVAQADGAGPEPETPVENV